MKVSDKKKLWLWIDPTSKCNLKCQLCYTKMSHQNLDMSPETLDEILEKLLLDDIIEIQMIHLNWRGEPLMNKKFIELLEVVDSKKLNVPLHWHTNGMLLDGKKAERIVEMNGDSNIYISIDGGNRQSHDKNRGEGTFEKSIAGATTLLNVRGKKKRPKIGVYQLNLGVEKKAYSKDFIKLIDRVDEHLMVDPLFPDQELLTIFNQGMEWNGRESRRHNNIELHDYNRIQPQKACFWAGNSFCINPEGKVSVCLLSHRQDGIIGNILKDSPAEIFQRAHRFRCNLDESGRKSVAHCKSCYKKAGNI